MLGILYLVSLALGRSLAPFTKPFSEAVDLPKFEQNDREFWDVESKASPCVVFAIASPCHQDSYPPVHPMYTPLCTPCTPPMYTP